MKNKKFSKIKKTKNKYVNEEQNELKKFVIIFIIVLIFISGIYLFSKLFIENDKSIYEANYQDGQINYDVVIAGTMFNRPVDDYYILAYDNKGVDANYYGQIAKNYINKQKNAKVMYFLELNSYFNKDIYAEVSNPSAKTLNDLKIKDFTLLHIKKGKIVNYVEKSEKIIEMLKVTDPKES